MADNHRIAQLLSECRWPLLDARCAAALQEAAACIIERFDPHTIFVCGSIIRGSPDATSDLDLYVVHDKELLKHLDALNPELARLASAFYRAQSAAERLELAGQIADHTVGARGFFEWETPPQEVPPPD